jgi:hypothetical protein
MTGFTHVNLLSHLDGKTGYPLVKVGKGLQKGILEDK